MSTPSIMRQQAYNSRVLPSVIVDARRASQQTSSGEEERSK